MTDDSFWGDEPLSFDPNGALLLRLLAAYGAATGIAHPKPAISGGGTYAKRLPNSITRTSCRSSPSGTSAACITTRCS